MQKKSDTEMIVSMPAHMSIEIALAEHAAVIRALGKRVVGDVIEMGRRLTDAKKIAGYGGWLPWLDREFGWSDDTARKLMQVSELAESRNLRDLSLPISGLYLLAAQVAVLDPAAAVAALGAAPPAMDLATRHSRTAAQPLAEEEEEGAAASPSEVLARHTSSELLPKNPGREDARRSSTNHTIFIIGFCYSAPGWSL